MVIEPRLRSVGTIDVRRLLPWRERRMVGPFIFLDMMGPVDFARGDGMDVDAHPHIGLSTLTYLLRGRLRHRDSLGTVQTITAGEVNWMTAGAGVCHTERSLPDDRAARAALRGLQFWVALPDADEDGPAAFQHLEAGGVPRIDVGSTHVRLLAGSGWGRRSPVTGSSPLVLADVELAGETVPLDDDHAEWAVLALDGEVTAAHRTLGSGRLHVFEPGEPHTVGGVGRAILLGGEPLGTRHIWWNFVHSDPDRIEEAKQRWARQGFPLVPDDHEPWVPLPEAQVGGRPALAGGAHHGDHRSPSLGADSRAAEPE